MGGAAPAPGPERLIRQRLAVALLLGEPLRTEVDGLRRGLGDRQLTVVAPHVTLVPPVNVRDTDLDEALALLRASGAHLPVGLRLEVGPVRTFAPANPVLYLAVGPVEPLAAARAALRHGVFDRPENHPFVPHVTIDIDAPPERLEAGLVALSSYTAAGPPGALTLLREERDADRGRHWEPIADAACGGPVVAGRGGLELELTTGTIVDPVAAALCSDQPSSADPDLVISAHRGLRPVGLATARRRGEVIALTGLVVDGSERGLGVGRALVARCTTEAAAAGARRVVASRRLCDEVAAYLAHLGWTPGEPRLGRDL